MIIHLYVFGYKGSDDHDEDFESTGAFRIMADTSAQALEWGHKLSEWYVRQLEGGASWSSSKFASWVEEDPDEYLSELANQLPVLAVGEYPDAEIIKGVLGD